MQRIITTIKDRVKNKFHSNFHPQSSSLTPVLDRSLANRSQTVIHGVRHEAWTIEKEKSNIDLAFGVSY